MELKRLSLLALISFSYGGTTVAFTQPAGRVPASLARLGDLNRQESRCLVGSKFTSNGRLPTVATIHKSSNRESGNAAPTTDLFFDAGTTVALVGGQSLLIVGSIAVAALIKTPNFGLGPGFQLSWPAVSTGILLTLPLGLLAWGLDLVEDKFPALQDVTKATQRSVLALLGGKFKPVIALVTSLALGCVAGLGEEMLFRGVVQYELSTRLGQFAAVGLSSIVFGALHAVTPLYAILASLASVYFGGIYIWSDNLAVPIACHAFYDLVALLFAHWTVCRLTDEEQDSLSQWKGPGDV